MNDTELNRLLDAWQPPAPPASLRLGLRARFPRPARRRLGRRLRWALALAVASAALAVAMEQSGGDLWDTRFVRGLTGWYEVVTGWCEAYMYGVETFQAFHTVELIRRSEPRVHVDGELAPPLQFGPAGRMDVRVPGDGVYSIVLYGKGLTGWTEAGRIHGNSVELQAGAHRVVIQCNQPLGSDAPVFVRSRQ